MPSSLTKPLKIKKMTLTETEVIHKVQLVDGNFTATEALDVINALIKEKINFHKIHRLSMWEGDMDSDTSYDDSRVVQLEKEKIDIKAICQEARLSGKKIRINGILNVEIID